MSGLKIVNYFISRVNRRSSEAVSIINKTAARPKAITKAEAIAHFDKEVAEKGSSLFAEPVKNPSNPGSRALSHPRNFIYNA